MVFVYHHHHPSLLTTSIQFKKQQFIVIINAQLATRVLQIVTDAAQQITSEFMQILVKLTV